MEWIEQNLDAYRILGEILNDIRQAIQKSLSASHGPEWYREQMPSEVFDRLVSTKEGETAIDWYDSEYQQIMDFAVFPDLIEILLNNSETFQDLLNLVPSQSLLQARFLELEVLRTKVGRARPVSDAELTFLMKFHTKFRQALIQHRAHQGKSSAPAKNKVNETEVELDIAEKEASAPDIGKSTPAPKPTPEPTKPVTPPPSTSAPKRPAKSFSPPDKEQADESETVSASNQAPANTTQEPESENLKNALESGDSKSVLRHLFREVTSLAESLWSSDLPPHPIIWTAVRTSSWYEQNFSTLGLKPLSNFFSVISDVEERMAAGLDKRELQRLLEEANFAQVLLALRDMFQRNRI